MEVLTDQVDVLDNVVDLEETQDEEVQFKRKTVDVCAALVFLGLLLDNRVQK